MRRTPKPSRQRQVERCGAAKLAAVGLVVERPGAMHGAAIVPDHEIMRPPDVGVDELPLRGMVDQVAEEQAALRHRPVDDMGGVRGEIKGAAAGGGNSAHQRMDGALQLVLLVLVEVEAENVARIDDGVIDAQALDRGAGFHVEGIVGGAHVGELRVGPHRRHHPRRQHRVAARRVDERGIGVPQAVGERGGAHAVVRVPDLAVLVDVRHVGQRLVAEPVAADRRGGSTARAAFRRNAGRSRAALHW